MACFFAGWVEEVDLEGADLLAAVSGFFSGGGGVGDLRGGGVGDRLGGGGGGDLLGGVRDRLGGGGGGDLVGGVGDRLGALC